MVFRIGLVGCGAIGMEIARALDCGQVPARLAAVSDRNQERARTLIAGLQDRPPMLALDELVEHSDLVVEAASQGAVLEVARAALSRGRDLMIMSVGALMDPDLLQTVQDLAEEHGCKVYLPSGAISGLDGLKSAGVGEIRKVSLTTTKNPAGLEGAPYILEKGIDLQSLKEPTLIFEGPAREAVRAFPANVNVAATLSLAYGGQVEVRIVADPRIKVNRHEILVEGDFGCISTRVENVPSPRNPRTSFLAALSAIATLQSIVSPIKIGT
ncbi:MAG: aspartate dehydrogenase [Methanosarcinales archaeon]|nr:aspartate dehydrogenase [Methanosarcinales archaeon]